MARMIWFDLDGTCADLYGEKNWRNDLDNENTAPYANARVLINEQQLLDLISAGYTLGVISWTSRNGSERYNKAVRKVKKEWLREHYPQVVFEHIHIVKYGTPKYRFMISENDVLIDDELQNRQEWKGQAFHPNIF